MTRIEKALSYAALATAMACANLNADVVTLTNLNDDFTSGYGLSGGHANAFTLGDDSSTLGSITFYMQVSSSDTSFTASIYSNNSGNIGSVLCSSTLTGLTSGNKDVTFSDFTGTTLLDSNTTYWVVLQSVGNTNSSSDLYQATTSATSAYGWSAISGVKQYQSGFGWSTMYSGVNEQFTISATVSDVPEPASYAAFFGLGVLGFAGFRRLRRTK
jgi:hypothetical protein